MVDSREPAAMFDILAAQDARFHVVLIADGVFDAHVVTISNRRISYSPRRRLRPRYGHCAIALE